MTSSNLVTNEEVERACKSLGIKDWSTAAGFTVSANEARAILKEVGGEAREVGLEDFREGLQVELEHGTRFPDANVTNNHPVLTGKIVLAHLKESLLYYKRLTVAELEGDLLKATKARDADEIRSVYERIVSARLALLKEKAGLDDCLRTAQPAPTSSNDPWERTALPCRLLQPELQRCYVSMSVGALPVAPLGVALYPGAGSGWVPVFIGVPGDVVDPSTGLHVLSGL
jgi:hypothetical protein